MSKLLSINSDSKTVKGLKDGYLTGILYLAPLNIGGFGNVCPKASKGCAKACLYTSGRGSFSNVQQSRINKTRLYFEQTETFFAQLDREIKALLWKANILGLKPCVRLNGTSDLYTTYHVELMENNPSVVFYDYTKVLERFYTDLPNNYSLTFSRSERNESECKQVLEIGFNVAVVFNELPKTYLGYPVINGDLSDVRFNDSRPCIVGLIAKGKARKDKTGFVV